MSREKTLSKLKQTLDDAKARIDALAPESRDIYAFGAGNTAHLYRKCFDAEDFHPKAYLDNNKSGGKFNGINIIAPGDVVDRNNALVLICSPQPKVNAVVSKQLDGLGLKNINVDEYFFALHSTEILKCAAQFDDDESASTYATIIEFRMHPENNLEGAGTILSETIFRFAAVS